MKLIIITSSYEIYANKFIAKGFVIEQFKDDYENAMIINNFILDLFKHSNRIIIHILEV